MLESMYGFSRRAERSWICDKKRRRGGGSATHVAHCHNICPYFIYWLIVLTHVAHCDNIFLYFICWCEVLAPLVEMQAAKQLGSEAAKRNFLISPQWTLPNKTIDNCFERGKKKFLSELYKHRNFRDKGNRRARAMRVTLAALAEGYNCKITRYFAGIQADLSLIAQDDENVEKLEPSPEFVILTIVRKRLRPLTVREVGDSVIQDDLDIYNKRKEK